jgi:hypothetical protein
VWTNKSSVAALARDVVAKAVEVKSLPHPEAPFPSDILVIDEVRCADTKLAANQPRWASCLFPPPQYAMVSNYRFSRYLRRPLPSSTSSYAIARRSMTCPSVSKFHVAANSCHPDAGGCWPQHAYATLGHLLPRPVFGILNTCMPLRMHLSCRKHGHDPCW